MVVGITRCKNEADIIRSTVFRMLRQVDAVLVMDGSDPDEGTREILEEMAAEPQNALTVLHDDTPTHEQPQQMTKLAHKARKLGAEWIIPFDADEVWLSKDGKMRDRLALMPEDALICQAPLFNHVATALDPKGRDPVARIRWRRPEPVPLPKVAVRARDDLTIDFGQHGARYDRTPYPCTITGQLEIRHFPYRTVEQFIRKIEVGAPPLMASGLPEHFGAHWRGFGKALQEEGPGALQAWFDQWAWSDDPEADPDLVLDPCPVPP